MRTSGFFIDMNIFMLTEGRSSKKNLKEDYAVIGLNIRLKVLMEFACSIT